MRRFFARSVRNLRSFPWHRLLALPVFAGGVFAQLGFAASFELDPSPTASAWKFGYGLAAACCFYGAGKLAARRRMKLTVS